MRLVAFAVLFGLAVVFIRMAGAQDLVALAMGMVALLLASLVASTR
jgi:hypothetical protein